MVNPSLKSRFMQGFGRFSRILAGSIGQKISPLEKKCSKNKNVQNAFFIEIIKNKIKVFYIYTSIQGGLSKLKPSCLAGGPWLAGSLSEVLASRRALNLINGYLQE